MARFVIPPLVDALAAVPDPRQRRGRRHPLAAILALACAAMLCDCDTVTAIAEWGRDQGRAVAARLGFRRPETPCVATVHRVLRRLDAAAFEAAVQQWAERVCAGLGAALTLDGLAIDGKTLRGRRGPALPAVHLLAAVSHTLGVVTGQCAVDSKSNEIRALHTLLLDLVVVGRVVTVDALLTQREAATTILAKGGTI